MFSTGLWQDHLESSLILSTKKLRLFMTCFYYAFIYQIKLANKIKSLMHDTKGTSNFCYSFILISWLTKS